MYNFFVGRVRTNLHLVICLSPIGEAFRTRLRMFPSLVTNTPFQHTLSFFSPFHNFITQATLSLLNTPSHLPSHPLVLPFSQVNCCTIDWFTEWPEEALRSVANFFLAKVDLDQKVKGVVVDVCVDMQTRVVALSKRFLAEMGRHYYVTPTSYLELISTFKTLLNVQRREVFDAKVTNTRLVMSYDTHLVITHLVMTHPFMIYNTPSHKPPSHNTTHLVTSSQ